MAKHQNHRLLWRFLSLVGFCWTQASAFQSTLAVLRLRTHGCSSAAPTSLLKAVPPQDLEEFFVSNLQQEIQQEREQEKQKRIEERKRREKERENEENCTEEKDSEIPASRNSFRARDMVKGEGKKFLERGKQRSKKKRKKKMKKRVKMRTDPNIWAYGWLTVDRRQAAVDVVFDMELDHMNELQSTDVSNIEAWCKEGNEEILVQWARLAEVSRCQNFANRLLDAYRSDNPGKKLRLDVQVHRPVLYSYCNLVLRTLYDPVSRRMYQNPPDHLTDQAQRAAQSADRILQHMESTMQKYIDNQERQQAISGSSEKSSPVLVDGSDYLNVILSYCRTSQPVGALKALRRMELMAEQNPRLTRLLPSTALYVTVMKCVLRGSLSSRYEDDTKNRKSPVEVAHTLAKKCIEWSEKYPSIIQVTVAVYNVALDAWSRVIPPPSGQKSEEDTATLTLQYGGLVERKANVLAKTAELWESMQEKDVMPNARTYMSLIYTYTKCDRLDDAYRMVETMVSYLVPVREGYEDSQLERVDSRCLSMLIHALSAAIEREPLSPSDDTDDHRVRSCEWIDSILARMWQLDEAGYEIIPPGVVLYTAVLHAWGKSKSPQSYERALGLVKDYESRPNAKPDRPFYNALIYVVSRHPNLDDKVDKAKAIIQTMQEKGAAPDTITYNTLIDTCLQTPEGLDIADQALQNMITKGGLSFPKPNARSYTTVILAWVKSGRNFGRAEYLLNEMEEHFAPSRELYKSMIVKLCDEGSVMQAKELLFRMEVLAEQPSADKRLLPKRSLFNTVITACEEHNEADLAKMVESHRDAIYPSLSSDIVPRTFNSEDEVFEVLKLLGRDVNTNNFASAGGNTYNFNLILAALANSEERWSGQRAEDIMDFMINDHFRNRNPRLRPNIITFNSVIAAWANSGHPQAGEKAISALNELDALHEMGLLEDVVADRVTYNTLMSAYVKEEPPNALKAQSFFDQLRELHESSGNEMLRPDIISYGTLLHAWARAGEAKRAEEILLRMHENYKSDPNLNVKPNTLCYNEVLYAWAKSSDSAAAKRAEMVLDLMEDMYHSGNMDVKPGTRTYNIMLLALTNSRVIDASKRIMAVWDRMHEDEAARPNSVSYTTAASALLKHKGVDALGMIMELLDEAYRTTPNELDCKFFAGLIYSLSKYNRCAAPSAAETIIDDLKMRREEDRHHIRPDVSVYNALINCWAKSGETMAPQRAEEILEDLCHEYQTTKLTECKPDVVTFTSTIDAWAKSKYPDAGLKGEAVLERMLEADFVEPNIKTYTAAIQCYARSNMSDKVERAVKLLERMKETVQRQDDGLNSQTVVAYNAVMNAAEFTGTGSIEEAFQVACLLFDEVRRSDELAADHVTYGTFMGVIAELMPRSNIKNDMIELVFKRCCADGQLAPIVLKKFQEAATRSQYKELMAGASTDSLPSSWTRNVKRGKP